MSCAVVSTVMGRGFKEQNGRCAKVWAGGGGTRTSIGQGVCPRLLKVGESLAMSAALH